MAQILSWALCHLMDTIKMTVLYLTMILFSVECSEILIIEVMPHLRKLIRRQGQQAQLRILSEFINGRI